MREPVRFVHTADWQLGQQAHFVPGDSGARLREARISSIRRIGEVASSFGAQFLLVAGDVFEHHSIKHETVRRAFDAMRDVQLPIFLLPGNHDPLTPDALYSQRIWERECPPNVRVLRSREPIELDGAVLLPCPLLERRTFEDVTEHLHPGFGPKDRVRIGVAHGGIREILQGFTTDPDDEIHNPLPRDLAQRGELDYAALGDWHSTLRIDERTYYSGTHEPTRFKEREPGNVLCVQIDQPGAIPVITKHRVATFRFQKEELTLNGRADVDHLDRVLDTLPDKTSTLVKLTLLGRLKLDERVYLDEILERASQRLCLLRTDQDSLGTLPGDSDADGLPGDGWLREVARRLRPQSDEPIDDISGRALRNLIRIAQDVS